MEHRFLSLCRAPSSGRAPMARTPRLRSGQVPPVLLAGPRRGVKADPSLRLPAAGRLGMTAEGMRPFAYFLRALMSS